MANPASDLHAGLLERGFLYREWICPEYIAWRKDGCEIWVSRMRTPERSMVACRDSYDVSAFLLYPCPFKIEEFRWGPKRIGDKKTPESLTEQLFERVDLWLSGYPKIGFGDYFEGRHAIDSLQRKGLEFVEEHRAELAETQNGLFSGFRERT